jgi:dTDP-4-amino-4,6-dideoxygalactose transaminase
LALVYDAALERLPVARPVAPAKSCHVYHLYVIATAGRDALAAHLAGRGIGTGVHYPVPVHLQPAYTRLGYEPGSLPHTEWAARSVLSLPLYPDLPEETAHRVAAAIRDYFGG